MASLRSVVQLARSASACSVLLAAVACTEAPSSTPAAGAVDKLVYAVRQHTTFDPDGDVAAIDVASGMGQVMDYNRYVPGGRLELLDLRSGEIENLIEDYPRADVSSVDLSFDASKVVFTMKRDTDDSYHVYWSPLERGDDGKFAITQLTAGPYDDQNAIFASGGRIAFATNQPYTEMGTRADEYNHARIVTQLAIITLEGGDADRKLCSQNLSHTVTLFSLQDGRIGFSRWEHLENVNDVKLFAMNPDCTQMVALSGQHGKPGNSVVQVAESPTRNVFFGIVTERENTIQAGALIQLDVRSEHGSAEHPGAGVDEEKEEAEAYTVLTPDVPRDDAPSPTLSGRYRSPAALPDGRVLVSWAEGSVNDINELIWSPPDYGIYVFDPGSRGRELVVNHAGSWELYVRPVVARDEPPNLVSRQATVDATTPMTLGSIDVRNTSLASLHGESVSGAQFTTALPMDQALEHAVKVRIIEGFSSEAAGQTMFGLTMAEGAALLGEAPVEADGSWLAHVPPYIPIHLQPVDEFDLAIRNQTTWIQGMPGESRVCGGCHERRIEPNLPDTQQFTIAAGKPPAPFMVPVLERIEYPWAAPTDPSNPNVIQAVLDRRCVQCHNETQNGNPGDAQEFYEMRTTEPSAEGAPATTTVYRLPRLDLSGRPITVTYDRQTREWPASYVSLFYPAALEMELGGPDAAEVTGTVPPQWAIPSDARHSALIEKLNVTSSRRAGVHAWALGQPFSDANIRGGTRTDHAALAGLTRDELVMLIRAIDMGGQFYARQNTGFTPFARDPLTGTKY